MEPRFEGTVALVTGGAVGIGRATALALAHAGCDLAINELTLLAEAQAVAGQIRAMGGRAIVLAGDVADQGRVESMVAETAQHYGRLDVMVANAGHSVEAPFHTADMTAFRRTVDVTMWGAYYCLRAAANQMIRQIGGGCIVVVGSPHAEEAIPTTMAYNMAKAAVEHMARTAAIELCKQRVRVNVIRPGWTDTPGERKYFSEAAIRRGGALLPWGRLAQPEEIARGVVFLVDPASDYITGSTLTIDGGLQLPWWSHRGTDDL
jgi:glucose 1-dehydrogenase